MIAILLDQGLAPRAAAILRERGFDVVHVMDIGMAESDLDAAASIAMEQTYPNPRPVSKADVASILEKAFAGEPKKT